MNAKAQPPQTPRPAFGSVLADTMAVATYSDGRWSDHEVCKTGPIEISPGAHALHYCSTCFEGFKAYRWADGSINVFRMERHVARMQNSARALAMPEPDAAQLTEMVKTVIDRCRDQVPEPPGALYMRPILFGTTPNIGAATVPPDQLKLIVLASPVWDYFASGAKPLRIYVEDQAMRCATHLGMVKTGGNYAAAMGPIMAARRKHKVDQVLFCPGDGVQETGAANFLLIRDGHIMTRCLDTTFLHGVTRDSLLRIAPDLGFKVEERVFTVAEMLEWVKDGEAALSGTAAVLTGIGALIYQDKEYRVGTGDIGPKTSELRAALVGIQTGQRPDRHGWLTRI